MSGWKFMAAEFSKCKNFEQQKVLRLNWQKIKCGKKKKLKW